MTITLDQPQLGTPLLSPRTPVRLARAAASLWRVIDSDGRVIGHLLGLIGDDGLRYRARRFSPASHGFRDLGDFWSADDAVDCLRYAR